MAAVAVSSAAMAQVTVSGSFGAAYESDKTAAAETKGLVQTDASIRFTASEDIGSMKATAFGQFAMGAARSGSLAKEDHGVTLSGGFGSISYLNTRTSDTAIAANVFSSWMPVTAFYATVSSRAAADVLAYTTPQLIPGLTVGLSRTELIVDGFKSGNAGDGDTNPTHHIHTINARYAQGPVVLMAAYKTLAGTMPAALVTAGAKKVNTELAAVVDLGVARIGLGYDAKTSDSGKALTSYGVSVPMGAITVGMNGAQRGDANFYDAGVKYDLSKRTSFNVMYGKMKGNSTQNANGTFDAAKSRAGSQYRIGVLHNF